MTKLKRSISVETAFGVYVVDELLGEGGAGRVYGGVSADGTPVAVKVLSESQVTTDKKRRFKNEIAFLLRNTHSNIVTVLDHGVIRAKEISGPFYVMRKYHQNLRQLMDGRIASEQALSIFLKILDGVEAAHLQKVVHRDIKPENILYDRDTKTPAIADFGIASFTEDILATLVETSPTQRLANFQYAAPEQRALGRPVGISADIYALGLILNEMYTGEVPVGTDYRLISSVSKEQSYLDNVVAKMIRQLPDERPSSIAELKALIQRHQSELISIQRLSELNGKVIKTTEVDQPLALQPPQLIGAEWTNGTLTLTLDRKVTPDWVAALRQMGSYSSAMGIGPETFSFQDNQASTRAAEHECQSVVDFFKEWLPRASATLKYLLEDKARREEQQRKEQLRREQQAEEQRLRVNRSLKI